MYAVPGHFRGAKSNFQQALNLMHEQMAAEPLNRQIGKVTLLDRSLFAFVSQLENIQLPKSTWRVSFSRLFIVGSILGSLMQKALLHRVMSNSLVKFQISIRLSLMITV